MSPTAERYDIAKEVLFGPLERIDVAAVAASHQPWWNRSAA